MQTETETQPETQPEAQTEAQTETQIIPGIDLGTSNSSIGIWRYGKFEIIRDITGDSLFPSIVSYDVKHKYVGNFAKKQMLVNSNTFYEIKRLIGRKYSDPHVQANLAYFPYNIEEGPNDSILVSTDFCENKYSPEEISSFILTKLKSCADEYLGFPISKVIITVPAYFTDAQRLATKDAATIAGLECIRVINEPTAAALAYGLEYRNRDKDEITILVYDLGGGTLDVSILTIDDSVYEVIASTGNNFLGGSDFDNYLVSWCLKEFETTYQLEDVILTPLSLQSLKSECERAKIKLTTKNKTTILVPNLFEGICLKQHLTRTKFEEICRPLFKLALDPLKEILASCELSIEQIDEIVMVGGATRIPKIIDNIYKFFGKMPNCSVNPDEVVTVGAAIQGFALLNKGDPFSESFVLLDITSLSLGIEVHGKLMDVIIPKHSQIPTEKLKVYTNDTENMKKVSIKIFEGERALVSDNYFVGEFDLDGIKPSPVGTNKIKVTFNIDVSGIINVIVEDDHVSDNKNNLIITSQKGRLSPDKIKSIIENAAIMHKQDTLEQDLIEMNYAITLMCDNIMYNLGTEHILLSPEAKLQIQTKVEAIQDIFKRGPVKDIEILKDIHLDLVNNYVNLSSRINDQIPDNNNGDDNPDELQAHIENDIDNDIDVGLYVNVCNELVDQVTNSKMDNLAKVECIESLTDILRVFWTENNIDLDSVIKNIETLIDRYNLTYNPDISPVEILENTCNGVKNLIKTFPDSQIKVELNDYIDETIDIILTESEFKVQKIYDEEKELVFNQIYAERLENINKMSQTLLDYISTQRIMDEHLNNTLDEQKCFQK